MSNKLIVAAAQTGPVFTEEPEAMLPAAIKMMEEAAKRNVQIVTFSELFMTPFFPNTLRQDFDHFFTDSRSSRIIAISGDKASDCASCT